MNDTAAHQILNATARADHQFASAGGRSDLVRQPGLLDKDEANP